MRVITDEQYQRWLSDTTSLRVLLAEVTAYTQGAEVIYRMGSEFFATEPTDTPANATYEGILIGQPSFNSRMEEAFGGSTFISYGSIIVDNTGGIRDEWIYQSFAGRPVVLRIGDPSWGIDDYRVIFNGVVERLDVSDDESLEISIRDKQKLFDQPIQSNFLNVTEDSEGVLIPLCYGEVNNISPVLDIENERRYVIHDGSIESIDAVYINGVATTAFVASLADGYFTLNAEPDGEVTCDVKGDNEDGYSDALPDIAGKLIARAEYAPDNISDSLYRLRDWTTAKSGMYFDSRTNLLSALDSISPGIYYGFDRSGEFYVRPLHEPETPVTRIDNIETYDDISMVKLEMPVWKVRVGYKRNWTPQTSVDESVTSERRAYVSEEYTSFAHSEDSTIKDEYVLSREPDHAKSMLIDEADAKIESQRLLDLFGKQRYLVSVSAYAKPLTLSIGDTVTLEDGRYGLHDGVDFVVVGLNEYLIDSKVDLELWR